MKKNIELRIAQIIFAIPFLFFGINHLIMGSKMAGMVPISPGTFWIYLTGIAQILAAIAFIINVQAKLAAYLLSFFLLVVILGLPEKLYYLSPLSLRVWIITKLPYFGTKSVQSRALLVL